MPTTLASLTLANTGFETGDTAGWTISVVSGVAATVIAVASADGNAPHGGGWFVNGGQAQESLIYQDFDVAAFASEIDASTCTLEGFSAWHNNNHTGQLDTGWINAWFLNATGGQISEAHTFAFNTTSWQPVALGTRAVPAGTRTIRLGVHNFRDVGPNLNSYWDDFTSPSLVTSLDLGGGGADEAAVAFAASSSLVFDPFADRIAAASWLGVLTLIAAPEKSPLFSCAHAPARAWSRGASPPAAWSRLTPAAPEPCTGETTETGGDLDLVSGDRLVGGGGLGLKLIG
ncbi:MAG TPA: hypothetical protein VFN88_00765 [Caulobacteraceae bacterium]|nr:hypothetical protein [Caulobacteraceae bacterium]